MTTSIDVERVPSVLQIQQAVARHYKIKLTEMKSHRRGWDVARPRQVAMYLARELTPCSYPEIARYFDRDHTTVIHAVHMVERLAVGDSDLENSINTLRSVLLAPGQMLLPLISK